MPRQNTIVPLPIGDGINQAEHAWLVRPPHAAQVQNFDLDESGAYRKRSGFESVVALEDGEGILLPQTGTLGVLSPSGLSTLAGNTLRTQPVGALLPTRVQARRIYAFRGAVSGAQIAYNGGYVGLCLTEADEEEGRNAVAIVVDASTWTIVAGPYNLPRLAHGARVEPIGTTDFLFLGVDLPSGVLTQESVTGDLYAARLGPGGGMPTQRRLVAGLEAFNAHELNVLYDSHGIAGQDTVYISYIQDGDLLVMATDGAASASSAVQEILVGANHSVWFDLASNTVLLYDTETNTLAYHAGGSLSGAWGVTPSVLIGSDLPMFHERADGLWLNSFPIHITGSGPGLPGFGASDGMAPTLHRRPQPRSRSGAFFFHRYTASELEDYGDRLLAGGEQITANVAATLVGGSTHRTEQHVVPLGQSRTDLWYMDHFHAYYWFDSPNTERMLFGVMGQSAKVGESLLVPQLVANSAYLAPPLQRAYSFRDRYPPYGPAFPTASSISGGEFESANQANYGRSIVPVGGEAGGYLRTNDIAHRTGGSNVNEGALQLVVEEVDTAPAEYTALDLAGSILVACGGLSVFDGALCLPAVLEAPTLANITSDPYQPNVYQTTPTPSSDASDPFEIDEGQSVSFRGVLFVLDRNGVKYRSDSFSLGFIVNTGVGSRFFFPKWTLTLAESHKNLLFAGRKLGIEVYASAEYASGTPPAPEPEGHTFVMRAAVQYDAASGQAFVSGSTLYDIDDEMTPISIHAYNPTTLYTETELGPQMPPASNVMAHAGNYLFLLSSEDPQVVWHSKPITDALGPEFHPLLTLRLPPESGGCVSLAGEADRLLLLCRNGVYELFVAGPGPDAEGTGSFPPLRRVYSGDGALNHACTVSGPFGTFFVSNSGPKIVSREGELHDVGRLLDASPTGFQRAVYNPLTQEIWLSRGEDGYILDTRRMAWTYTTLGLSAGALWNRALYRVTASGALLRAQSAAVQDAGVSYRAKYVSPWITFDGPMGFSRVRKVGVLIQPLVNGNGSLRISLAYDYVDSDDDRFTYSFSTVAGLLKPIQLWVRPRRQKLDAIRITVEDLGAEISSSV